MKKIFTLLSVMIIMTVTVSAQAVLFTDNFDDGNSAAKWTIAESGGTNLSDFAYDYVTAGIEAAPNGGGLGLRFDTNTDPDNGMASQIVAFANDVTLTAQYTITFDLWMNYTPDASGTTEYAIYGVNHSDQLLPSANGIDIGFTGDGGSGHDLWLYYEGVGLLAEDDATVYGNPDSQNFDVDPYMSTWTGDAGGPGNQWLGITVNVTADSVIFKVNDVRWAQVPTTAYSGDIMVGLMDIFSSVADNTNFAIYDNVVVTEVWPENVNNVNHKSVVSSLYPNPANDVLNVVVSERSTVELVNTIGQVVFSSVVEGNSTINVSNLNPGMYLAKVTAQNGQVEVHKVLVK